MRFARRFAIVPGLVLLTVTGASIAQGPETPAPPRLVLVLSIDQMRADYLTRFDDLFEGGFRTLLDQGAVFTSAMYRHASTETGPGHAVILSGRHPSSSGIVGNTWFDPLLGRSVNVIEDPFVDLVGASGRGASPANFIGFTVGDALKRDSPESKVVGVAVKDRSAILMGGRLADGAFWYEPAAGQFVTSTWYMSEMPEWLRDWNARGPADRYAGATWTRLVDDEALYETYAGPDAIEGEANRRDTVFPHAVGAGAGLLPTPFSDLMTSEAALEALAGYGLGSDDATDILAVGFSGTDYVGHNYGPDSQEVMDDYLRLDRLLEDFFEEIDRLVGLDRTLIVLTSDHGVMPLVEVLVTRGVESRRVDPRSIRTSVVAALGERYEDPQALIASFSADGVTLNHEELRIRDISRGEVEEVIGSALEAIDEVAAVYTWEDLAGSEPPQDPYLWLYRNAFFPSRSPDLVIRLREWLYPSSEYVGGTGHGTPYDYDRHVPIIVMGEGIPAGRFAAESGPEDIAPTLAVILGLDYPKEPDARVLSEILP